jgi:hypothetical protein
LAHCLLADPKPPCRSLLWPAPRRSRGEASPAGDVEEKLVMPIFHARTAAIAVIVALAALSTEHTMPPAQRANPIASAGPMRPATIASGKTIFREDTYGDESFWTARSRCTR